MALAAAAALTLAAAGCSSSSGQPSGAPSPTGEPTAQRASFDPPVRFDPAGVALPEQAAAGKVSLGGLLMDDLALSVQDLTGYLTTEAGLQIVDLVSGKAGDLHSPTAPVVPASSNPSPLSAPALVRTGTTSLAVAAFVVTQPASGTTPEHRVVEVLAVDTATGEQAWQATLELPQWAQEEAAAAPVVKVLAASSTSSAAGEVGTSATEVPDGEVIVTVDGGFKQAITWGLIPEDGQQRWQHEGLLQATRIGDVVLGNQANDQDNGLLSALNVADGTLRWQAPAGTSLVSASAVSPTLAGVNVNDYASGENVFQVLNAGTGTVTDTIPTGRTGITLACHDDGAGTGVCGTNAGAAASAVIAYDGSAGTRLWNLPQDGSPRVAPALSTAWHGAVYGTTTNGPVVLDAKTGADREVSPGAAPVLVNDRVGVAVDSEGSVSAYTPIG
ncbi:outer membrane protein assembly factor BamB family protein [Kineococcus indalonis]|uniref:outer membrane protein assembly factor BamB family protein n=1 Tax=Kineococcus indalonis TaxID=2696566 RepID=UPI001412ABD8|nr:PQQ-binding-like beta-propeller repeat protein [Kineococcus indalonis]NAZ84590.1 PQQ-binding-like beta-propeller repeat protein [Kineococcus indalonis]